MYRERMIGYYPPVLQSIAEFQGIINGEYPELEEISVATEDILSNAYLSTMGEERLKQWEKILNIVPVENSTLEDRRDTIMARIRGQGKLNTTLINTIVSTFTGGTANSWIEDGVLNVEITPPPDNKSYIFANVEQELTKKIPAHLGIRVFRNYAEWGEVESKHPTWTDVSTNFSTWNDVLLTTV